MASRGADVPLYAPSSSEAAPEMASAIALRTAVAPMSSRVVRFAVAWHAPELVVDKAKDNRTYCDSTAADYGRFHHNFFGDDFGALLSYAASARARIEAGTLEWIAPILRADSALPDWLKFKLVNSAYTLFTNGILTRGGDFSALEGGMGGLGGTMDQRITAHPFYQKFFPTLDNAELAQYAASAIAASGKDGDGSQIMHFDTLIYAGVVGREAGSNMFRDWKLDTCGGWIWQVAKTMEQSANLTDAKRWWSGGGNASAGYPGLVPAVVAFMQSQIQSTQYAIPTGPNTFDDFWHPPLDAYAGSTYPLFLDSARRIAAALGNASAASALEALIAEASSDFDRAMFNGDFFAYGCELNGTGRLDSVMFSGQLAGQFMARLSQWSDVVSNWSHVVSAVKAQLTTNVNESVDYYAPKVWNLQTHSAMVDPHDAQSVSSCWPFYLEDYVAMTAITAGFLSDGLDVMKHIQLVNARQGYTWRQNLWSPSGYSTYVAAPVTWFITDILASSGLNLNTQTLYLSPAVDCASSASASVASFPIYFPTLWAIATADCSSKALHFAVSKTFGAVSSIKTIVAHPIGAAVPRDAAEERVVALSAPFALAAGATLDLSAHWSTLIDPTVLPSVL
jgi:hypothetical protein